jgi:site-specific DNA-methyltransferase (adenine-specific)
MIPILKTPLGELHQTDCLELLKSLEPESVDLAFADPPFNLGKKYSSKIDDAKANHEYL